MGVLGRGPAWIRLGLGVLARVGGGQGRSGSRERGAKAAMDR